MAVFMLGLLVLPACSSDTESTPTAVDSPSPAGFNSEQTEDTSIELIPWSGSSVVETKYGAVEGFEDASATWHWKAIPFAKPPVGELRWKAPLDPEPWDGIRAETEYCSPCVQYDSVAPGTVLGSEDCLYLNVWRPQSEETDLPVYVWIHGGGNSIGSATQTSGYNGANLASKSNMVFVSMNYRLGPLGWFTHPALRTGEAIDVASDSGNYGTLDLIQSLKWIQDNIQAFGGDPDRVIITGESAGAMNVLSLMVAPDADGLFQRAMAQSSPSVTVPLENGEADASEVLYRLLMNDGTAENRTTAKTHLDGMSNDEIETYLRSKTVEELLEGYQSFGWGLLVFPSVFADGNVLATSGFDTFGNATHVNRVPLIIGSTKEETKIFLFMDSFFEGKDDLYQVVAGYSSDLWKANGVDDTARKLVSREDQPDVYVYQFLWGSSNDSGESPIPEPWGLKLGSAHSLDIPFFLGNENFNEYMTDWVFTEENRAGREALTDAIMQYVAQFVRTGNPNQTGTALPQWNPWTNEADQSKLILFNTNGDATDIEMDGREFTLHGIMERMKQEVSEPLYSQAIDYMRSFVMVSYMLEDLDLDTIAGK